MLSIEFVQTWFRFVNRRIRKICGESESTGLFEVVVEHEQRFSASAE